MLNLRGEFAGRRPGAPSARRALILSAGSGLLLALAFPRSDLFLLAFVALVPLLMSLEEASRARAIACGYACGAAFFGTLLYWVAPVMSRYGGLPWPLSLLFLALLVFYLASYVAVFAAFLAWSWRRAGPLSLLACPVAWVALEILRGRLLTGFPWGLLGYSQVRNLPLLQAAAFGGIYAVSFLVMAVNAGIALLALRPAPRLARPLGIVLLLLGATAEGAGLLVLRAATAAPRETVRVAALQPNVAQDRKWRPNETGRILADLVRMTREAAAAGARVVVWPESSSPLSFRRPELAVGPGSAPGVAPDAAYVALLAGLANELDISLIVGSVDYRTTAGELRAYNSAVPVLPDGTLGAPYDKVHLVPFGEYVPLARLLFFVNRMAGGAIAEFASGTGLAPLPTASGDAATFICYEAIFPELVRRLAGHGGVFMVNLTNDAWFGRSPAAAQHLAMAVARTVENRRALVRAANTGISALIDPYGRVLSRSGLMIEAVVVGTLPVRRDATPYARAGDWLAWGCVILTALYTAALRAAFERPGSGS